MKKAAFKRIIAPLPLEVNKKNGSAPGTVFLYVYRLTGSSFGAIFQV